MINMTFLSSRKHLYYFMYNVQKMYYAKVDKKLSKTHAKVVMKNPFRAMTHISEIASYS